MLSIKQNEEQRVYVTSDWHLGHQRDFVWEVRGYKSHEDHTDSIIDVTNSIVRPSDILLNLGDFCLNTPQFKFEEYLSRIKCQNMWLLWGNHNNPHEKNTYRPLAQRYGNGEGSPSVQVYPIPYRNLRYLGHYYEVAVDGQMIVLFHYPIVSWNHMATGSWMIHGHMHCHNNPVNGKILDVGWDGYKKPLSLLEVKSIMDSRPVLGDGGHHS